MPIGTDLATITRSALSQVTDEGIFATGAQVTVTVDGNVAVDIATGTASDGSEMTADTLHNVYCLCKPMPYLLLGHALERIGFGPDEPLNAIATLPPWVSEVCTYRQLVSHDVALAAPSSTEWRWTPPTKRLDLLVGASGSVTPAYSEVSGGLLAEFIIEHLSGQSANRYCANELLEPLGLADDIIIDAELAAAVHHRMRVPIIGLPIDPLPMLSELLPTHIQETRLAIGAYATMRGAARLFGAIGQVIAGSAQPGLPSPALLSGLLDDDRPLRHDPILDRPAKWAAGLMTDINQQGISQTAGPGAVGHTSGLANSAALYDPGRLVSIALYLNGMGAENDDHILPRRRLMDTILNAISST